MDKRLNAPVSETLQGEWVGSVPVHDMVKLSPLREDDLGELLHQAVARG